jgi:hypothetical protein
MPGEFERDGLHFRYPDNWDVEPADSTDGWSVLLQSPQTAFVLISVHPDRPEVEEVLETALAALREDYPELEAEKVADRVAKRPARGYDIQFFSMDLVNTCWVRSFRTKTQTVLMMFQTNDLELEDVEPVFQAIKASVAVGE